MIDTVDLGPRLPNVACVYFLTHPDQGLLYVGRAVALSQRFEVSKNIYQQRMWDLAHAWLYPCYRLGNVRLSWWTIPSDFIEEVESAAIKILHPRLNERGRASLRDKELTERLQDLVRGNPPPFDEPIGAPEKRAASDRFPERFSSYGRSANGTLGEADIRRFMAATKRTSRNPHRDAMLILFLFRHALRLYEIADLRWDDIDFDKREMLIPARRGRRGRVDIVEGDELRALRKLRRQYPAAGFIFTSERGGPLSGSAIQYVLLRAGESAGVEERITPHTLSVTSPVISDSERFRDFFRDLWKPAGGHGDRPQDPEAGVQAHEVGVVLEERRAPEVKG
ncbi:MAG: tyrosine-type recombinase/integrase [Gammaproteobacteria bacterium]